MTKASSGRLVHSDVSAEPANVDWGLEAGQWLTIDFFISGRVVGGVQRTSGVRGLHGETLSYSGHLGLGRGRFQGVRSVNWP
jgi:hypothetical protein